MMSAHVRPVKISAQISAPRGSIASVWASIQRRELALGRRHPPTSSTRIPSFLLLLLAAAAAAAAAASGFPVYLAFSAELASLPGRHVPPEARPTTWIKPSLVVVVVVVVVLLLRSAGLEPRGNW
ncbi:hypothetical protein ABZP36_027313 [Zizania latifolia]